MTHVLSGAMPALLLLCVQLIALGTVVGLALAVALARTAAIRPLLGTLFGVPDTELSTRTLITRGGVAGLIAGAIVWGAADITHSRIGAVPAIWPLLAAFGVGALARLAIGRPILTTPGGVPNPDGKPDATGNSPTGTFLAGTCGVGLLLLAVALIAYRTYLPTVGATASLGGLLGMSWLVVRGPVLRLVRRTGFKPIGPSPQFATVLARGVGVGILASSAALIGGAPLAPAWSGLGLVALVVIGEPVRRYVAPPPIVVYRQSIGGHQTTVLEAQGRGDEHAPPIFLLHGLLGSADWMRPLMQAAARRLGCRLVAVSVPGVAPHVGELDDGPLLEQLESWLRVATDELFPDEDPVWVAASLLGAPTLMRAMDPRSRLRGAYLIGTLGLQRSRGIKAVAGRPLRDVLWLLVRRAPAPVVGRVISLAYRRVSPTAEQWAVDLLRQLTTDPVESERTALLLRRAAEEIPDHLIDLRRIVRPVRFAWGAGDTISPASNADRARAAGFDVRIFDDGGHAFFRDYPEAAADDLTDFVRSLRSSDAARTNVAADRGLQTLRGRRRGRAMTRLQRPGRPTQP